MWLYLLFKLTTCSNSFCRTMCGWIHTSANIFIVSSLPAKHQNTRPLTNPITKIILFFNLSGHITSHHDLLLAFFLFTSFKSLSSQPLPPQFHFSAHSTTQLSSHFHMGCECIPIITFPTFFFFLSFTTY